MLRLTPDQVVTVLKQHLLVDGFDDLVIDLKKSQGNFLYDSLKEREYLDLFGFFATAPIGYNHPALKTPEFKEKIVDVAIMKPSNSDFYTTEMAEFVQTFSKYVMPDELPFLFMISGGALGVENALKAAFDWKVRKNFAKGIKQERGTQVIHFKQAFHGRTGYTLSLTNTADPRKVKHFPKFNWPRITTPKITFPLNDENLEKVVALERQAIDEIKAALHADAEDIASIIIEPIQAEGGDNHFRRQFLQQLRTIADESEVMLIFDEVQTGIGLTGKMWCFEHFDVLPDMIAFGKKAQVCGFLCGKRIEEVDNHVFQESSRINSTWGGNLVDMVRCRKYLEVIVNENLVENARTTGAYFVEQLKTLQDEFGDQISNVRGRGFMIAFDLPSGEVRTEFLSSAYSNGLLALGCGEHSVRFRPALDLSQELVDEAMSIVRQSLREVLAPDRAEFAKAEDESKFEL